MNRPNLFIIGAPKCGTTAWYHYLGQHPRIAFAEQKEPHYFCEDFPSFRWANSLETYLSLFADLPQVDYLGEASVMYMYSQVAIKNIYDFNPDAKIIVFLKPYDQFFISYHSQILLSLDEDIEDPELAWNLQEDRKTGHSIPTTCRESKFLQYRQVAKFGQQLRRLYDHFPREQVKVVQFEQWTQAPRVAYLAMLKFLDLPDDGRTDFQPINTKRRNRYRWLAKVARRPPGPLLAAAKIIRRLLGVQRLGLASRLQHFNEPSKAAHATVSPQFRNHLLSELAEDQVLLDSLLRDAGGDSVTLFPTIGKSANKAIVAKESKCDR